MGIYSVNTVIVAFLGGSDAANDPVWAIYFLILFLIVAIPVAVIIGLIILLLRSFRNKPTNGKVNKNSSPGATPYIIAVAGLIFIIANIGGSKYSERSIVLDSLLLTLPFLFGVLATLHRFPKEKRKVFLILTFVTALIFLYYHYPRWF